jgi:hypothetical protein
MALEFGKCSSGIHIMKLLSYVSTLQMSDALMCVLNKDTYRVFADWYVFQ